MEVLELEIEGVRAADIQVRATQFLDFPDYLETTGVVSPNESRIAHIRPLSPGVVKQVFVRRGDRVRRGQPLIQYDNVELGEVIADYLLQQAELRNALAQREVAVKFWDRAKELWQNEAIAKKEVELREAEYRNAEETVRSRRVQIARTEVKIQRYGVDEQDLDTLKMRETAKGIREVSTTVLKAPFEGTVTDYEVAVGELVSPERSLLTVADLSTVWVLADIYERDIGSVFESRTARVVTTSYPDEVFDAEITYMSDVLDPDTRTVKARCEVFNQSGRLKLGMFATIRIPRETARMLPAVPVSALQTIEGQSVVFVQLEEGRFEKRRVETGPQEGLWIGIKNGLHEGEMVVTQGSFSLKSEMLRESLGGGHTH
ncbi:efflux RND transporter periplasmic adaptor subunit [Acidobacteria bacterium AH-259-L09]|nr:efflux RND transporter periplasmic adaptor subunit [Acidobacteria bacterium AH-259-L09]